ncbi:MAG TPA: hypothetical protein VN038_27010, partial [Dyadobacter sp.]|nr:hypothetical protein [Dyadobacter sp.]
NGNKKKIAINRTALRANKINPIAPGFNPGIQSKRKKKIDINTSSSYSIIQSLIHETSPQFL